MRTPPTDSAPEPISAQADPSFPGAAATAGVEPASETVPERVPAHAPGALSARDRNVIVLLLISAFVVILNETILSVALPPIMADLQVPETTAQWLTTGFMLTMAVVIPTTGYLMGRFSTRQVFTLAMTTFTVGTLLCAIAPGFLPLLLGRIVQAVGTAIMMPLLMTTVLNLVPRTRHGRVMGNISIVIAVAPAVGPTISGLVLSFAPWRGLFLLVLPIAIGSLLLGLLWIQNVREATPSPLDPMSVVLSALAFGPLVYGLTGISGGGHGGAAGGAEPGLPLTALACLIIGVAALSLFVGRQLALQKRESALLDLRTFASRNFSVAVVLIVVMMSAMFGILVLLPLYLQLVLELSTLTVGLMMLPGGLLMGLAAPVVGRLFDRVGPRPLLIPGLILVVIGIGVLSRTPEQVALIVAGHMIMSAGLSLVFTPLLTTALGSLPRPLYGHGSATVTTLQQVAGAAGAALMVALMSRGAAAVMADGGTAAEGISAGTSVAFTISAALAVVTVVIALFLRRNPVEVEDTDDPGTTTGTAEDAGEHRAAPKASGTASA